MWLARDENGELTIYLTKPTKENDYWISFDGEFCSLGFTEDFPEVKWEDTEPKKCKITVEE